MTDAASPWHVLVVAPQPLGHDLATTLARCEALYDALEAQGDRVAIEWLRPATPEALLKRLAAERAPAPLLIYLDSPLGLEDGLPALSMEGEEQAARHLPWPALREALAQRDTGPTLLILGAGLAVERRAALAADASGVRLVALPQGLGADAARDCLAALLTALLAGRTLSQAVAEAQKAAPGEVWHVARDAERPWWPVNVTQASGVSKVIAFPSPDLAPAWRRLPAEPAPGALPPEPPHGFVGRAEAMWALERLLSSDAEESVVWLCGYAGLGKTTLAAHLARWLVRTGRFDRVVYTRLGGGCLPEVALHDLYVSLLGEAYRPGESDPLTALTETLDRTPTLILWDDIEAVLPTGEQPWPSAQMAAAHDLVIRLTNGAGRLILLANAPDLPAQAEALAPADQVYVLGEMAPQEAQALVDAMARPQPPAEPEVGALLLRLGGHPLALGILAPLLAAQGAEALLSALREALPGLEHGEARLRNQALEAALDRLWHEIPAEAQGRLAALGQFAGGFMEMLGREATGLEEGAWQAAMARLGAAQLVRRTPLPGLTVSYVTLHPALERYLRRRLTAAARAEAAPLYADAYRRLASWLPQLAARSEQVATILFRHELPNLLGAVEALLAAQEVELAMAQTQQLLPFLRRYGWRDTWNLTNSHIERVIQAITPAEGPLGRPGVRFLLNRSDQLIAAGRVADAGTLLQQLVARMGQEKGLSYSGDEATLDRGVATHRLARWMQSAGRPDLAVGLLQLAAQLLSEVTLPEAKRSLISALADQSGLLLALGQGDKAEEAAQRGLQLATVLQDTGVMGALQAQLGTIAMSRNEAPLARQRLLNAIDLLSPNPDDPTVATLWQQLGVLAWESSHDAAEADRCLAEASAWAARTGQHALQVRVETRRAEIEEATDRPEEAERRLIAAVDLCRQRDQIPELVSAGLTLAEHYVRRGLLDQALARAEEARLAAETGLRDKPWQAYAVLRQIAAARGDADQERHWRRQAQEAFVTSPESQLVRQQWASLIEAVAQACRGQALDVETAEQVEKLEAQPEWRDMAQAIWRVLGGERGEDLYDALDHLDAVVIQAILARIHAPKPPDGAEADAE